MNSTQQAALESIVNRALTLTEVAQLTPLVIARSSTYV